MAHTEEQLADDIEKIGRIPIINTLLNVVCETTGMGFAAVARVTEERWIACSVRDDIGFGLKRGAELKVETTICNEIRDHRTLVVIDHVAESEAYCNHHTPLRYGFQSYISMPILLHDGSFFGTLCAIDPAPRQLDNEKVKGLFRLFAELIAFHLETQRQLESKKEALQELGVLLTQSVDENNQYRYISNHHLQEPLRKMRLFTSMLTRAAERNDLADVKALAGKVEANAGSFIGMINELSDYAAINNEDVSFVPVDLNETISLLILQMQDSLDGHGITVSLRKMPVVLAIPHQMKRLFSYLINYLLLSAGKKTGTTLEISTSEPFGARNGPLRSNRFVEINLAMQDNHARGHKGAVLTDFFTKGISMLSGENHKKELAYCYRIVQRNGGRITAHTTGHDGVGFSLLLPVRESQTVNVEGNMAGV